MRPCIFSMALGLISSIGYSEVTGRASCHRSGPIFKSYAGARHLSSRAARVPLNRGRGEYMPNIYLIPFLESTSPHTKRHVGAVPINNDDGHQRWELPVGSWVENIQQFSKA